MNIFKRNKTKVTSEYGNDPEVAEQLAGIERRINDHEVERQKAVRDFLNLRICSKDIRYETLHLGEYPQESDEVWVEAHSGDPGVRHDDLVGFIILSDLRKFLRSTDHIYMSYRTDTKVGCEFPVGSTAIKIARRKKK